MEEKKTCSKCGEEKPATKEYFSKNAATSNGFEYACKECRSKYQKARRLEKAGGKPAPRVPRGTYKKRQNKTATTPLNISTPALGITPEVLFKAVRKAHAEEIIAMIKEKFF